MRDRAVLPDGIADERGLRGLAKAIGAGVSFHLKPWLSAGFDPMFDPIKGNII